MTATGGARLARTQYTNHRHQHTINTTQTQTHKQPPRAAQPTPSGLFLYSAFSLGFNAIVFLVNLAIVFLLMGAFLWLAVAYAANQAIRYGVR